MDWTCLFWQCKGRREYCDAFPVKKWVTGFCHIFLCQYLRGLYKCLEGRCEETEQQNMGGVLGNF